MLDTFELEEARVEEKRQAQTKVSFEEVNFNLPAYDSVEFWQMLHGSVEMSFGKYSTEVKINIGEFGFTLEYSSTGLEIEKDGIWSEFPKKFAEFYKEVNAERCGSCYRIYDEGEDCPCFEDENKPMAEWNLSRKRFFGIRLGDVVRYLHCGDIVIAEVCELFEKNNNLIRVALDGGYKDKILPQICTVVKRVGEPIGNRSSDE